MKASEKNNTRIMRKKDLKSSNFIALEEFIIQILEGHSNSMIIYTSNAENRSHKT